MKGELKEVLKRTLFCRVFLLPRRLPVIGMAEGAPGVPPDPRDTAGCPSLALSLMTFALIISETWPAYSTKMKNSECIVFYM